MLNRAGPTTGNGTAGASSRALLEGILAVLVLGLAACSRAGGSGPAVPSDRAEPGDDGRSAALGFLEAGPPPAEERLGGTPPAGPEARTGFIIRVPVPREGEDVVVRLGCDVVTGTQLRAEVLRKAEPSHLAGAQPDADPDELAADPERWRAAFAIDPQPWVELAQEWFVRRMIFRRQAEQLGIAVTDEEVEQTTVGMMAAHGWDEDDFARKLEEWHDSRGEWHALMADLLLEHRVLIRLEGSRLQVTAADVRAEYDRLAQEAAPQAVRPFEEACAAIRRRLVQERWIEVTAEYLARMRPILESLPTRVEDGLCVEEWPEAP